MPDGSDSHRINLLSSIDDVAEADWDALLGATDPACNPFPSHDFLKALEVSHCVGAKTGWLARHLAISDGTGKLVAGVPLYVKGHSYGEYVFDWAWADAYERAGGKYYPKLLAAVPFSPVPGPRLLAAGPDAPALRRTLLAGMIEAAKRMEMSSLHLNFITREEWELAGESGFLLREGRQFHWHNEGYADFDDFLAALSSRKRKNLRKERERATEQVTIRRLTGDALRPEHWDAFYDFYLDTAARKWGSPYLTCEFFHEIGTRLKDRILLVMAFRDGMPVAGALNLFSDDAIFGRNWGCSEDHPFLHFECCYYQAMEFAIERGLKRVEAGAGGHHKLSRGYMPVATYSAHWIENEAFRNAVARFLKMERAEVGHERDVLSTHAPFRQGANDGPALNAPRSEEDEEGF
jgi:predicted N-acyltransferase